MWAIRLKDFLSKVDDNLMYMTCTGKNTILFLSNTYIPYLKHLPEVEDKMFAVRKYPWSAWAFAVRSACLEGGLHPSSFLATTNPELFESFHLPSACESSGFFDNSSLINSNSEIPEMKGILARIVSLHNDFANILEKHDWTNTTRKRTLEEMFPVVLIDESTKNLWIREAELLLEYTRKARSACAAALNLQRAHEKIINHGTRKTGEYIP
jgi:hypothetical protein